MLVRPNNIFIVLIYFALIFLGCSIKKKTNKQQQDKYCWENIHSKIESHSNLDSILSFEISEFQLLVEQSLVVRSEMIQFSNEINLNIDKPISSKHLEFLKSKTETFLVLRDKLYDITYWYECAQEASKERLVRANVKENIRTKAVMLSVASALTLYDNYLIGALIFENDPRLRRLSNDPDIGFDVSSNVLLEITLAANSIKNQKRIQEGISFFEKKQKHFISQSDNEYEYLKLLIYSSPSYNHIKNLTTKEMVGKKFKVFGRMSQDIFAELKKDGFDGISKFFGNSIGLVEFRKGKLYKNEKIKEELLKELQPLDVILEKTPFRLTDKLIPGHFGHVAIWVGNENELKEKGLWDNEVVKPFHDQISSKSTNNYEGNNIVEALRSGVKLSSLDEFMNIDDIAILRPIFNDSISESQSLLLAFRQLGKKYDFNFDVNTTEKIVCSELAYVCFPQVDWPTEKTLGRHTISPDNVANQCIKGVKFKLITFYHDGVKCQEDKQMELFKSLVE